MRTRKKTVYVAMSGGVDSSTAAALLRHQGFAVRGVFMKPWHPDGLECMWRTEYTDAKRVAEHLGIPFEMWDFSKTYGRKVAGYMVREYAKGRTPNPDVMCNKELKFGRFFRQAMRRGADLVATGHYARIARTRGTYLLAPARDQNKDQTYFLWTLGQTQLSKTVFPIGHLTKPQVRAIARRLKLPVADKKDSQGICFIGEMSMKSLLQRSIPSTVGQVIHVDGRILGTHDGAAYYTIGQRHGMNIRDGGGPYYVVRTDVKRNVIVVGTEPDLLGTQAKVKHLSWCGKKPKLPLSCTAQIRYRTAHVPAVLDARGVLRFRTPVRAIARGQSVVIRRNGFVLGGGVLA